ncbi:MAG TPA: PH domain-containing protein [Actinomycetes bacterium]|nr:PH domain-containing protein [Actinomycetes bacterium]
MYGRHRLADDEDVVLVLRPHWAVIVLPVLAGLAALVVGAIVHSLVPGGFLQEPLRMVVIALTLAVVGWLAVRPVLRWATTRLVVTNERLLWRRGLLSRHSREIPLERLSDVTVSQSLVERLFGLGDLLVQPVGELTRLTVADLPHPERVLEAINRQVQARETRHGGATPPWPSPAIQGGPAPGAGVVQQLQHLAELRDRGVIDPREFQRIKEDLLRQL